MGRKLQQLHEDWVDCDRCGLVQERNRRPIVFGTGKRSARFLLIYDTPTEQDVTFHMPMCGIEGEILLGLLKDAQIEVAEVYCTPLLGCRPTMLLPEHEDQPARIVDRAPVKEELMSCFPRIQELIYRIDPRVIFTLGDLAWKMLVKPPHRQGIKKLEKAAGNLFVSYLPGRAMKQLAYDVIPLLSMKQLAASPSVAVHGPRSTTLQYLERGKHYSNYLISKEKKDAALAGIDVQGGT